VQVSRPPRAEIRLQSCPSTLSIDLVGLVFLFSLLLSGKVKEPF
jgi:hypothetical protein